MATRRATVWQASCTTTEGGRGAVVSPATSRTRLAAAVALAAVPLAVAACGGGATEARRGASPDEGASAGGEAGGEVTLAFRTHATEEGPDGLAPRTRIELVVLRPGAEAGEVHPVLEVEGVCHHRGAEQGALLRLACWWAGAGDTLDVVLRGGELVVTRQQEDEGLEEPLPVEVLRRIPLGEGTRVRALAPDTLR